MTAIWQNLSIHTRRLMIAISTLMVIILIGMQFHVSSQGDMSETYPKGFRGGTCTIESDTLLIGYSAYFIPKDYEIPQDALSAMSVPILCGKVPSPGILSITIDLLYPVSVRERSVALSLFRDCLLYTSDAADERSSVDLGGRRMIKKKKQQHTTHTQTN